MKNTKYKYSMHGVVNERAVEDRLEAVSDSQAYYLFRKKYGFNMYDFTILNKETIMEQISMF